MDPNLIRSIIFLIAGLILIIFPEKLMALQDKIFKKINIKQRDTKKSTILAGMVFLIIAAIIFTYSLIN
jgi:hypothetical protein